MYIPCADIPLRVCSIPLPYKPISSKPDCCNSFRDCLFILQADILSSMLRVTEGCPKLRTRLWSASCVERNLGSSNVSIISKGEVCSRQTGTGHLQAIVHSAGLSGSAISITLHVFDTLFITSTQALLFLSLECRGMLRHRSSTLDAGRASRPGAPRETCTAVRVVKDIYIYRP